MTSKIKEEGQCPNCEGWFEVVWEGYVAPFVEIDENGKEKVSPVHVGGYWWKDSSGCPGCDAIVLVESECNFRKVAA